MQNEPNLPNAKINLNYYIKRNYGQKCLGEQRENEPKRTQFLPAEPRRGKINHFEQFMQNKPNLRNDKMNINLYSRKDYRNLYLCGDLKNKPNQTQFRTHNQGGYFLG